VNRDELQRQRDDVPTDFGWLAGKRVLVTGGGGSIGGELAVQIAQSTGVIPYLLDRDDEHLCRTLYRLDPACNLVRPELLLCDIRTFDRVATLFHAAAMKDVVLGEAHAYEAIETNVRGTMHVASAALAAGVETFVNVSTDKAADPINVMGRTKRIAELYVAQVGRLAANMGKRSRWISVRFGNVLGSTGSITEVFRRQARAGGPVTVTHPDIERYFMTLTEAVGLVVTGGSFGRTGQVLILEMGKPVRIQDVARRIVADEGHLAPPHMRPVLIEFTGLRPGEKLTEQLAGVDEQLEDVGHPAIRAVTVPEDTGARIAELLNDLHQLPQVSAVDR
jgi:FlaA1/EpsC-like NDP-sugar epimerase